MKPGECASVLGTEGRGGQTAVESKQRHLLDPTPFGVPCGRMFYLLPIPMERNRLVKNDVFMADRWDRKEWTLTNKG